METIAAHFLLFTPRNLNPHHFISPSPKSHHHRINLLRTLASKTQEVGPIKIKTPPSEFDFRSDFSTCSRSFVTELHPELLDLVENGSLVVIEKNRFGPLPLWRAEFVEPEEIWLIGTSHISEQSAVDVERVVQAVRPDNVLVELCRSRAGIMYMSNERDGGPQLKSNMFSLSGDGLFGAIGRSINLGGQTAFLLRLLLAFFSSKISSDANRPFGDEFRAARKASEEIGAQLVLGDRPIEITLERAWNSLKWNEKLNLLVSVMRGIISPSSDMPKSNLQVPTLRIPFLLYGILLDPIGVKPQYEERDSKVDENPFQLYEQLSISYPSLLQPLIHERDTYLAWSLKRSKAVNNCKRVVGVVGKSHMNGVIYALVSDLGDLRFHDLAGYKKSNSNSDGWIDSVLKNLVRDALIGILLWGLYEQLSPGL